MWVQPGEQEELKEIRSERAGSSPNTYFVQIHVNVVVKQYKC